MEKYCSSCGRVFKDSDFRICPYCGEKLSSRGSRQPIPRKLRHRVFQRDGYRCRECGATNKETILHVDHIRPVSKGGTNNINNLQTLCEKCNMAKYTDEWTGGVIEENNEPVFDDEDYCLIIDNVEYSDIIQVCLILKESHYYIYIQQSANLNLIKLNIDNIEEIIFIN